MLHTMHRTKLVVLAALVAAGLALGGFFVGRTGGSTPAHASAPANASAHLNNISDGAEYAKLSSLSAGMYIGRFEAALGVPVFIKDSNDGSRIEKTFDGPGYLVQTIQDSAGTVELMAVTACRADFNPTFTTAIGAVTLGISTMGGQKLAGAKSQPPFTPRYFVSPATSNTYAYDQYYLGNPGYYKTYIVGVNDACKSTADYEALVKAIGIPNIGKLTGETAASNPAVQAFRNSAVINTYAETGPRDSNIDQIIDGFQIGADRIRVRTLPPPLDPSRE